MSLVRITKSILYFLLLNILFIVPQFANAQALMNATSPINLGKELELKKDLKNGSLQLGVHYGYDSGAVEEKFTIQWRVLFNSNISQEELNKLPKYIYWNLLNTETQQYLWSWSVDQQINRSDLVLASLSILDQSAKKAIGQQAKTILVFADDKGKAFYYLDIGALCKSHPENFKNITEFQKSCDAVSEQDIDDHKANYCDQIAGELLEMVSEKVFTCQEAQERFIFRGCENLVCQE